MNSGNTFKQLSLKEIIAKQTKANDEVKQRLDTNESSLKDILNKMDFLLTAFDEQNILNKRVELKLIKLAVAQPVATNIEQVKNLTTSAAILNKPPKKKEDTGCPTIDCSIGNQHFNNALCDLGASVSVMPTSVYKKLEHPTLEPTSMCLQLADQSVRHLLGIAENIPLKIRDFLLRGTRHES